jgi:hypothetical protein
MMSSAAETSGKGWQVVDGSDALPDENAQVLKWRCTSYNMKPMMMRILGVGGLNRPALLPEMPNRRHPQLLCHRPVCELPGFLAEA